MEAEFSSLLSVANIGGARAIRADIGFLEKRGCTKRSAGASLTFDAMTGDDRDRIGTRFSLERSTATACDSGHRTPPFG